MNKPFFLFILLIIQGDSVKAFSSSDLKRASQEEILEMYQMLKDTHELFSLKDIEYWAAGGTLLGAVRQKGIIPWDLDLDIFISQYQEDELVELVPIFEDLGYSLYKKRNYIYVLRSKKVPTCHMDIIFTYVEEGKVFYSCEICQKRYRRGKLSLHFLIDELYPLQLCDFGKYKIFIAANPYPYLNSVYGLDCLTHAIGREKIKVKLLDKDMGPALPMGPLKDKFNEVS